jgi:alpha-L-fucosidase
MIKKELPVPTEQQIKWQDMEMGMFCHFGMNTFHDQEWGSGKDSPLTFCPSAFDARQWARTAKLAGFKYLVLTAKHHDGFCLWPTKTTDYSVKASPWREGKGDVVKEVAEACREEGILFGVYLSPWDRHESCYPDKEAYDNFYAEQLTELLTGYGPIVEVWFDGAGSEGREYDWPRIISLVKKYQPDSMIFNMGAPTIRWPGNEDGLAPYPCWNSATQARISMFTKDMAAWLPETPKWVPAECDVPIRGSHWFWHPNDEGSLRSVEDLLHIYYNSVGHGANLLLNLAPDNRGLIPEADIDRVLEFSSEIKKRFSAPISKISGQGYLLKLDLPEYTKINHVILMEDIAFGERVRDYKLEAKIDGIWIELLHGSAIGHKKIDRFNEISVREIRLKVISAEDMPVIRNFSVYYS